MKGSFGRIRGERSRLLLAFVRLAWLAANVILLCPQIGPILLGGLAASTAKPSKPGVKASLLSHEMS